ncbi:MAG TPA: acyl carrier protein, partial [Polyangia bacterium]|nr:acyl carrier protein [Polyangia bacterium]
MSSASAGTGGDRRARISSELRRLIDDVSGVEVSDQDGATSFLELGLDSLALTQVALQIQKTFSVKVTFRQLMETYSTLDILAEHMDKTSPPEALPAPQATPAPAAAVAAAPAPAQPRAVVSVPVASPLPAFISMPAAARLGAGAPASLLQSVVDQQLAIMAQQLALLSGARLALPAPAAMEVAPAAAAPAPAAVAVAAPAAVATPPPASSAPAAAPAASEEEPAGMVKYDVKKAFGAIARIHSSQDGVTPQQRARLEAFIRRYTTRTK